MGKHTYVRDEMAAAWEGRAAGAQHGGGMRQLEQQ